MMRMIIAELMMTTTMVTIKIKIIVMMRLNHFGSENLIIKNYCYAQSVIYICIMLVMCIRNLV